MVAVPCRSGELASRLHNLRLRERHKAAPATVVYRADDAKIATVCNRCQVFAFNNLSALDACLASAGVLAMRVAQRLLATLTVA